MPKLTQELKKLVQRSGSNTGNLRTDSDRVRFQQNVKQDLSNIIAQLNSVYFTLAEALLSDDDFDPLDFGIAGNVIASHKNATAADSSVFFDTTRNRSKTIKESFDTIISEISRLENDIQKNFNVEPYDDTEVKNNIATNDLNLKQLRLDTMGANYTFDNDGAADLTFSISQAIDAIGSFFSGFPGTGNTYTTSYPGLSFPQASVDDLTTHLNSIRTFIGMDTATSSTSYSQHGPISIVTDTESLEQSIQKLDETLSNHLGTGEQDRVLGLAFVNTDHPFVKPLTTKTFTFVPVPADGLLKKLQITVASSGGGNQVTPDPLAGSVSDIRINGVSKIQGLIPIEFFASSIEDLSSSLNIPVSSGDTIEVDLVNHADTYNIYPLMHWTFTDNVSGLEKEYTLIGLPALETLVLGAQASATLDVESAPATAGDTITITNDNQLPASTFTLTGVSGPRTSGSDDFDATVTGVDNLAQEIVDAINDPNNSFAQNYTATKTTTGVAPAVIKITAVTPGPVENAVNTLSKTSSVLSTTGVFSGGTWGENTLSFGIVSGNLILRKLAFSAGYAGNPNVSHMPLFTSLLVDGVEKLDAPLTGSSVSVLNPSNAPSFNIPISSGSSLQMTIQNPTTWNLVVRAVWLAEKVS